MDMNSENIKRKKSLRIVIGIIAAISIISMWVEKDIVSVYTSMPQEEVIPLIATTVAVYLIKVVAIAGGIMLIKLVIGKIRNA